MTDVTLLDVVALRHVPLLVLVNEHLPVRHRIVSFLTSIFRAPQSLVDFENRILQLPRLLLYLYLPLPRSLHDRMFASTQTFRVFKNLDCAPDRTHRTKTDASLPRSRAARTLIIIFALTRRSKYHGKLRLKESSVCSTRAAASTNTTSKITVDFTTTLLHSHALHLRHSILHRTAIDIAGWRTF